jgi:hypothetical protein
VCYVNLRNFVLNKQYVNMKRYLITTLSILTAGVILWAMWANTAPMDNEQYVKDMCTTYHNSIAEGDTAYAKYMIRPYHIACPHNYPHTWRLRYHLGL